MAVFHRSVWRTRISSNLKLFLIPSLLIAWSSFACAQNFDPSMKDKMYLNKIQEEIQQEVNQTRVVFYKQAQALDRLAKQFVAAQIKENLFIVIIFFRK